MVGGMKVMSWEDTVAGPQEVLAKHHAGCEHCTVGFYRTCPERETLLTMQDAKVLCWQERSFSDQGWEINFH